VIVENVDNNVRYLEMAPVQGRPYFLRLTHYLKVAPLTLQVKGKNVYKQLNGLKNYIS